MTAIMVVGSGGDTRMFMAANCMCNEIITGEQADEISTKLAESLDKHDREWPYGELNFNGAQVYFIDTVRGYCIGEGSNAHLGVLSMTLKKFLGEE